MTRLAAGFTPGRPRRLMAGAAAIPLSHVPLSAWLERVGALSERQRTGWTLAGCLLLAVLLRAP